MVILSAAQPNWENIGNFCGSQNRSQEMMQKVCQHALKSEQHMQPKSLKIVSEGALLRGMDAHEKNRRKSDPPKPSQEGSRLHERPIFTFSLSSPKVNKMVAKSSKNGDPKRSQSSLERV